MSKEDNHNSPTEKSAQFNVLFGDEQNKNKHDHCMGMACAVAPGNLYVTANHVLDNGPPFTLLRITPNLQGQILTAEILWRDEERDVALLKATGGESLPFFTLGMDPVTTDDLLLSLGKNYELSAGRILPDHRSNNDAIFIRHSTPLSRGDSGGPIVDAKLHLSGVNINIEYGIFPWIKRKWTNAVRLDARDLGEKR